MFLFSWRRFRKNPNINIDGKLIIQEAFVLNNKKYYQCATATDLAAGRGLNAMIFYEEFRMKCDKEYLELHVRATEKLLAGDKGVVTLNHLLALKQITGNLLERVNLVAMPDHVFKLASVYFWDESESPYFYDFEYNRKKIEEWKKTPEALSFFLSQPLKEFLPFSKSDAMSAPSYLEIAAQIGQVHQKKLEALLSRPE